MRLPAEHTSPWLMNTPNSAPSTAASQSASAKNTLGDFPPSSSVTRFNVSAAAFTIIFPTAALPVNAILSTPGCATSAAPVTSPTQFTTFTTPGGNPTSSNQLATSITVSGVCSAGFSTQQHPAASAGASFHAAISNGKFHGIICPATPTGSRSVKLSAFAGTGFTCPVTLFASPP